MGIKVTGLDKHLAAQRNRLAKIQDQSTLMRKLSALYLTSENPRIFREGKSPAGVKWPTISEATKKAYLKKFKGVIPGSTLRRKGDLMRSVQRRFNKKTFIIFTNDIRAATHQFGDKSRGIPERPFMGFSQRFLRTAIRLTEKFLASAERN